MQHSFCLYWLTRFVLALVFNEPLIPRPFCSARIAREEDEREAERLELEERRGEEKKKKKARFIDD